MAGEVSHQVYETHFDKTSFFESLVLQAIQKAVLNSIRNDVELIIEDILLETVNEISGKYTMKADPSQESCNLLNTADIPITKTYEICKCQNIKWPTIEQFSVEGGKNVIEEFITSWALQQEWKYCIEFISHSCDLCNEYFYYQVKWSIPTPAFPIPQAVASVLFTIQVSKIKPDNYPVQVTFAFEGHRSVHTPGKTCPYEKFLQNIIDSKIKFITEIRF